MIRNVQGFYKIPGFDQLFPSVTTVLKVIAQPQLQKWREKLMFDTYEAELVGMLEAGRMRTSELAQLRKSALKKPDELMTSAGQFGTRSHAAIQSLLENKELSTTDLAQPDLQPVISAFCDWQQDMQVERMVPEKVVYSEEHMYAGTVDAIGYRTNAEGRRVKIVLDWKTSRYVGANFALQLAAYAHALQEMEKGEPVEEAWVVQFSKTTPEYKCYRVLDLEKSWTTFHSTLQLWKYLQQTSHFDPNTQ